MLHLTIKSLLINEKEEFLILRLYIINNLNLRNTNLNAFRLFIKVVQFAGSLRSDIGAV